MEHTARFADERLHLSDGVVPRGALVNDAIQPEFGGDFHLLPENVRLLLFAARIVVGGGSCFFTGQMMVSSPVSPMATTLGCRANSRKAGRKSAGAFIASVGCQPTGGKDAGKFFREPDGAFAAVQTCADGNDFRDAGGLRLARTSWKSCA